MDHPPLEHVWMVDNSPLLWLVRFKRFFCVSSMEHASLVDNFPIEVQHPTNVPSIQGHRWMQRHSSFPIIPSAFDTRASSMDHFPLEHAWLVDNSPIGLLL